MRGSIEFRLGTSALAPVLAIEEGKQKSRLLRLGSKADVNSVLRS